jgi:hypothetical protein
LISLGRLTPSAPPQDLEKGHTNEKPPWELGSSEEEGAFRGINFAQGTDNICNLDANFENKCKKLYNSIVYNYVYCNQCTFV